jgi:protein transport protein SEC20
MTQELARSRFAQETLEQSTAALADLGDRYITLDSVLSNSKNLLGTLLRSQKSDTWYLETALWILIATVVWLLFRRLLYGPLWWFLWIPLRLSYKVLITFFSAVGLAGTSTSASLSSSATSRTLIVKPSATGKPVRIDRPANVPPRNYMPAGAGGYGAKHGLRDPSPPGSMSEQVGKMAEELQKQGQGQEQEEVRRADGTVLEDRPKDKPANSKKRMWDENVESKKREEEEKQNARGKDEL